MPEQTLHFTDMFDGIQSQTVSYVHYPPLPSKEDTKEICTEFTLHDLIGEGGMGFVYSAEQSSPLREVAIKSPKQKLKHITSLMLREANLTGRLEHPNIIPIYLVRQTGPCNVEIIMRRIQGKSMLELINNDSDTTPLLQALVSVCYALEYAHSKGIVHRDVKPENIMLGEFGEVYLMDWGIALDLHRPHKMDDVFVGSPAYMAPEMTRNNNGTVGPLCDVYLLGSTLHHILTKEPRHMGSTLTENILLAQNSEPFDYPLDIPTYLGELCNMACHDDPTQRPQDVSNFRERLEEYFTLSEAENYISAGHTLLSEIELLNSQDNTEQQALLSDYYQARFAFEQARAFPSHKEQAEQGIQQCMSTMLNISIQQGELQLATAIYTEFKSVPDWLEESFQKLKSDVTSKKVEYQKLRNTYDKTHIKREGKMLGYMLLGVIITLITGVTIYDFSHTAPITGERLLISSSVLAVLINALLFFNRNLRFNAHHRRLQSTLGFGSALLVVYAAVGAYLNTEGNVIMRGFLGIVGLTFANVYPFMRHGYLIGIYCVVGIVVSMLWPDLTHPLFMCSGLFASSLIFFQNSRDKDEPMVS